MLNCSQPRMVETGCILETETGRSGVHSQPELHETLFKKRRKKKLSPDRRALKEKMKSKGRKLVKQIYKGWGADSFRKKSDTMNER